MKPNSPRLQKRLRHEFYFKNICFAAILFALGFLIFFGIDITRRALPAFHQHFAVLEVDLDSALLDPHSNGSAESLKAGDSRAVTKQALRQHISLKLQRGATKEHLIRFSRSMPIIC